MKLWLPLIFCLCNLTAFAQSKELSGIVFDKESKGRIAKVNVQNTTSGKAVYNSLKGEFKINAAVGDILIFSKPDHYNDTIQVKNFTPLAIYMRPQAIQLQQVTVRDTMLNPQKRYQQTRSEYSRIYGSISSNDFLVSSPGAGAGIGIDAIYNSLSRSGRNASHLREIIDLDYKQTVIDYRFNKTFVASVTKLKDPQLSDFMLKYRPGYYQVTTFNDYEFIASIRANLRRFLRNPRAFDLPALPVLPPPPDEAPHYYSALLKVYGMALFPFILIQRSEMRHDPVLINHERIHLRQQAELLVLPFYLLYLLNYLFNLIKYRRHNKAYMNIVFEREAYGNDANNAYLNNRKWFSWYLYF